MSKRTNILTLAALPGIVALFAFSPETAKPMSELAERLLRDEHPSLSRGERELIVAGVSMMNNTEFCMRSHEAFAKYNFEKEGRPFEGLSKENATPGSRQNYIVAIAVLTAQNDPAEVKRASLEAIEKELLTEREIHDIVLIASAFCMYNRYVSCLDAPVPQEDAAYEAMAERIYNEGYIQAGVTEEAEAQAL